MSNYTKVYDGAAKDTNQSVLAGADFDVEFDALAVAVATKADKVTSPTTNGIGLLDANGNLIDSGNIVKDTSGNEIMQFASEASAVNYLKALASATGNSVEVAALGDDTNIDITLTPKGTGKFIGGYNQETFTYAGTQFTVLDTALPTWVKRIEIVIDETVWSSQQYQYVQFGVGGTYTTAGYFNHAGYNGDSNSVDPMNVGAGAQVGGLSHDNDYHGKIVLHKLPSNRWMWEGWTLNSVETDGTWSKGSITMGGVVTDLRIGVNSGTVTSGNILVSYAG